MEKNGGKYVHTRILRKEQKEQRTFVYKYGDAGGRSISDLYSSEIAVYRLGWISVADWENRRRANVSQMEPEIYRAVMREGNMAARCRKSGRKHLRYGMTALIVTLIPVAVRIYLQLGPLGRKDYILFGTVGAVGLPIALVFFCSAAREFKKAREYVSDAETAKGGMCQNSMTESDGQFREKNESQIIICM